MAPNKAIEPTTVDGEPHEEAQQPTAPKDLRFWLIILALLLATFLAALDLTAISTALPTISAALHSREYAWIGNAYSVTSAAFVPWAGGLAHVFGRRVIMLGALAWFFVGSALCGAAQNMDMMLAGRAFQGVGAGAILTLTEIVLADLVPLSERGAYQGAFGAVWALASATGPPIGGALASSYWPALFYINLPLTAIVAVIVGLFLKLKTPEGTYSEKLGRMDWLGNLVFIPSITLLIIALCWGGQEYSWSSAHVLAPMIIGVLGLVAWFFLEKNYVEHPTVPFATLGNWTTGIGYMTTLIHGISALCLFYFWPVYFQSVKGATPVRSAVDFFSVAFITAPFAMVAGASIGALQMYKPQNVIAWILMTAGPGILSLVTADSPTKAWAPLPIPWAIGVGLLYAATVFPVLAPLPPALAGKALAFLVFLRSFGNILGITVGSVVLNNELAKRAPKDWVASLPGGLPSAFSAIPTIKHLPQPLQDEVRQAFARSIRIIWFVVIPFGGVGLILSLFMRSIKLQTQTDENWGVRERRQSNDPEKTVELSPSEPSGSGERAQQRG
ncbi:iron permease [Leucosporidium creatinivorum]|uniref:Iron permease n=1 Tax=Leucosporidium creatinivorum TaxID=106004 RepID=A0A1Y2FWX7_9BASI|nr:iron permease [Leucosporidium creatinivorum]